MERKDLLLLGAGIAAAALAAGIAIRMGGGSTDQPGAPPVRNGGAVAPAPDRAGLPSLGSLDGVDPAAAEALRKFHGALASGTRKEAAAALASLAVPDPKGPIAPVAPDALEALAPALGWLVAEDRGEGLAGPAMEAAAGLARRGGTEGRKALERSGLVDSAFAIQAAAGPPALRRQAALLLGSVATDRAVGWLVRVLEKADEAEVREAAAAGLAEAHRANGRLPHEAHLALKAALDAPGTPAAVRRAVLGAIREAFSGAAPYGIVDGAVAALADPDPGTRMAAADLFFAHPVPAAGAALVRRAAEESDPRVLAVVAATLGVLRPVPGGAAAALEARLPSLADPAAAEAVRRALRSLGAR